MRKPDPPAVPIADILAATPPLDETCASCDRPFLGGEKEGRFPADVKGRFVHPWCRDWKKVPFPFERELRSLQTTTRKVADLYARMMQITALLMEWKRAWPAAVHEHQAIRAREMHSRGLEELARLRKAFTEAVRRRRG